MTDGLCVWRHREPDICLGIATVVDHINGWRNKIEFWDKRNWQPMCVRCHAKKTNMEIHGGPTKHGEDGMPTDPDHPWNKEEE